MVFYTVIMGIIDLSVLRMQIEQDLRKTKSPLMESSFRSRLRNKALYLDLVQNLSIEQLHSLHARLCGSINFW